MTTETSNFVLFKTDKSIRLIPKKSYYLEKDTEFNCRFQIGQNLRLIGVELKFEKIHESEESKETA